MKTTKQIEFIYFIESFIQSFLSDCATFGFIFCGLLLNRFILGDHIYVGVFFMIIFLIFSLEKGSNKSKKFNSLKEFKDYVNNL